MRLPVILTTVLTFSTSTYAQITTQDLNTQTPTEVANKLLGNGITISNVTYTGDNSAGGTFNDGTGIVGIENGVILSSGKIADVVGPNNSDGMTTNFNRAGDPDLQTLIPGYPTHDAAVLEFDFVPLFS